MKDPFIIALSDIIGILDNICDEPEDDIPDMMEEGSRFLNNSLDSVEEMLFLVSTNHNLKQRVSKTVKLRTAWGGYVARTLFSYGMEFRSTKHDWTREAQLERLGYNRERELTKPFVVALSGDMEADLKVNFVARTMGKMPFGKFLESLQKLYGASIYMAAWGFKYGLQGTSWVPRVETTEIEIGNFFDDLVAVLDNHDEQRRWEDIRSDAVRSLASKNGPWGDVFTLPASMITAAGVKHSTILPGVVCATTYAVCDDMHDTGVSFHNILGGASRRPPNEKPLSEMEICQLQNAIRESTLIWAERRQLGEAKKEAAKMKAEQAKLKELEQKLEKAVKENEANKTARVIKEDEQVVKQAAYESLRRKLQKAEARVARLEKENRELRDQSEEAKKAIELAQKSKDEQAEKDAEIERLTKTIFELVDQEEQDSDGTVEVDFDPALFDGMNIVVVGGWPKFDKGMEAICPDIHCFGRKRPPDSAIRNASVVWIQRCYISHPETWRATNICRTFNIPFRFFNTASVKTCQKQLVAETQIMKAGKSDGDSAPRPTATYVQ